MFLQASKTRKKFEALVWGTGYRVRVRQCLILLILIWDSTSTVSEPSVPQPQNTMRPDIGATPTYLSMLFFVCWGSVFYICFG